MRHIRVRVERLRETDLRVVVDLEARTDPAYAAGYEEMKKRLELFPIGQFAAVAEEGGACIAYANYATSDYTDIRAFAEIANFSLFHQPSSRKGFLYNLHVREDCRHKGIGRELIERSLSQLSGDVGIGECLLAAPTSAAQFYRKVGFYQLRILPEYAPGYPCFVLMRRTLQRPAEVKLGPRRR